MNHAEVRAHFQDHLEGELGVAERGRVDAHLADCPACAGELRALRESVSLLRSLPDPEPPAGLAEAVMARLAADAHRPRGPGAWFRRLATPLVAVPVVAGVGALLAVGLLARGPDGAAWPDAREGLAFFGPAAPAAPLDDLRSHLDSQLDRALERLLENPGAFFERLEDVAESDRLLAQLAERAARRGDAVAAASRLLASEDPRAEQLATRFLHASLVESVERRARGVEAVR